MLSEGNSSGAPRQISNMRGFRGGRGSGLPGKSQVAIEFLRYTSTDPLEKQLDPLVPISSRGRSIWLAVKYFDE